MIKYNIVALQINFKLVEESSKNYSKKFCAIALHEEVDLIVLGATSKGHSVMTKRSSRQEFDSAGLTCIFVQVKHVIA